MMPSCRKVGSRVMMGHSGRQIGKGGPKLRWIKEIEEDSMKLDIRCWIMSAQNQDQW